LIAYGSIYGHTANAASVLAALLADRGVKNIAVYDVSVTHPSYILSDAFRFSHIVFAAPTYNGGIFPNMERLLLDLKAHSFQSRTVAFIENGSWAPQSGKLMKELVSSMKNMRLLENTVTLRSSLKAAQEPELAALADKLADGLPTIR
jgi:flavorubredoxin